MLRSYRLHLMISSWLILVSLCQACGKLHYKLPKGKFRQGVPNKSAVVEICNFQQIRRRISEMVQDKTNFTVSRSRMYTLWINTKIIDLGWPWTADAHSLGAYCKKWIKTHTVSSNRCGTMNLVSGNMIHNAPIRRGSSGGASSCFCQRLILAFLVAVWGPL